MAQERSPSSGPDLTQGVTLAEFLDGKLAGHVGDQEVLLVHSGTEIFAVAAHCSHYHGPLAEGLVVGDSIRCPWHHACFDLRSGEAVRAPAINSLACWQVEQRNGRVFVREKREQRKPSGKALASAPDRIVIVGGGAAGFAAAEMLRRREFRGSIVMLSSDAAAPVDRPNLSKDYLAGSAPEDWMPLRPDSFYSETGIELRLNSEVIGIDIKARHVVTAGGGKVAYDRLLLATGAEPVRLPIPGADQPHLHTLRSLADCRAIIDAAKRARRVLVIGASFIGLEVAAALRARKIEVHVVAPKKRPMERVLGPEMGDFVRALHEEHGVVFHLEDTVVGIEGQRATLKSGGVIEAGLVVVGIGVRPRIGAGRTGRPRARSRYLAERFSRNERPRYLRRGRYRALARSALRRDYPRGTLGGRTTSRTNRSAQHARAARKIRFSAVLLEPALRCADQLCRSRRAMG